MNPPTIQLIRSERQAVGTASKGIDVRHQHSAYDPVIAEAEPGENLPFAPMFSPAGMNIDVFTTRTITLSPRRTVARPWGCPLLALHGCITDYPHYRRDGTATGVLTLTRRPAARAFRPCHS
jgi:hypothetical protein